MNDSPVQTSTAESRGPIARWLGDTYADMTPGQRWTTCLVVFLAVMLVAFGLRKGSVTSSYALGSPTAGTTTAASPSAPGSTVATSVPEGATALGPLSTLTTAARPAPVAATAPPSSAPPTTPGLVIPSGPAVTSEGPQQQGWWWQGNAGSQEGLPAMSPPADVPTGGLLIEGGMGSTSGSADACASLADSPASACTAYGGLVFAVPEGSALDTLTLTVHDASGTALAPDATPATILELCPLRSGALNPEPGGPMSDGPSFDCARNVSAAASSGGSTYTFKVGSLPPNDGVLAVAVLPTAPTDRVVLDPPAGHSLQLANDSAASRAAFLLFLLGRIW